MGETRLQLEARRRATEIRLTVGREIRRLREDAGLTLTAVAEAAGVDRSFLRRIELGERGASMRTLAVVLAVLGADLSIKGFPTTGPRIHDRFQAPMVEGLLHALHRRWTASPEVPVLRPARGVIDIALRDTTAALVVATELQSEVRRLEQQIRWHREKELSLPSSNLWSRLDPATGTSRLLVLRSTMATRELARTYEETFRAAYPARAVDVVSALTTGGAPWPGPGIAWMRVEGGRTELLDRPPRSVTLGR